MNDRMEQEMKNTLHLLQASMPQSNTQPTSAFTLLRVAATEINPFLLLAIFAGTLAFGFMSMAWITSPMLTAFCTTPMPMLLLFHRYVFHSNDGMRELEETFQYSYAEMLSARTTIISCYTLVVLLSLSTILWYSGGENFLRLTLCGAVPSVYLCALLLMLSGVVRNQDGISMIAIVFWVALCFFSLLLPFNKILQVCSTSIYATVVMIGFIIYGICFYRVRTGGCAYAVHT